VLRRFVVRPATLCVLPCRALFASACYQHTAFDYSRLDLRFGSMDFFNLNDLRWLLAVRIMCVCVCDLLCVVFSLSVRLYPAANHASQAHCHTHILCLFLVAYTEGFLIMPLTESIQAIAQALSNSTLFRFCWRRQMSYVSTAGAG
jgi:hypothetical protein